MSIIEDLKKDKTANDVEITELKKDIKKLEKKDARTPREEDNLRAWRSRLSELTQSNDKINHELGSIEAAKSQAGIFFFSLSFSFLSSVFIVFFLSLLSFLL